MPLGRFQPRHRRRLHRFNALRDDDARDDDEHRHRGAARPPRAARSPARAFASSRAPRGFVVETAPHRARAPHRTGVRARRSRARPRFACVRARGVRDARVDACGSRGRRRRVPRPNGRRMIKKKRSGGRRVSDQSDAREIDARAREREARRGRSTRRRGAARRRRGGAGRRGRWCGYAKWRWSMKKRSMGRAIASEGRGKSRGGTRSIADRGRGRHRRKWWISTRSRSMERRRRRLRRRL